MDVKSLTMEEKIIRIEQSDALNEVSLECLPPVQTDKYYFVSYSHKDYKHVYKDIFYLQENGFSIWYDRGMEAGRNWKQTAEKYITKYNCSGVIFFLSENSILSDAIHEELKLLVENGKDFLTINLPVDGKYMSAKEMLDLLKNKGIEISSEKYDLISKYLNEDIIYLNYNSSYEEKIEKLQTLKTTPLFKLNNFIPYDPASSQFQDEYLRFKRLYTEKDPLANLLESSLVKDIEVKEITLKDFQISLPENLTIDKVSRIGNSSLANCYRLEFVELPTNTTYIGTYAFYNCEKLKNIDLSNVYYIDSHAFENCTSLKNINLSSIGRSEVISSFAFKNCTSLENIILPNTLNRIDSFAFENTNIKEFTINELSIISTHSFLKCKNLEYFSVNYSYLLKIATYAFSGCDNLKEFNLQNGEIEVYASAFEKCEKLKSFPFEKVTKIAFAAFSKCIGLTSLNLQGISIGDSAFAWCSNVTELTFTEKESYSIGASSFRNLTKLKKVVFAPKLTGIYSNAFYNCTSLKSVYIPEGVEEIFENAFDGCLNLKEIHFGGTLKEFVMIMKKKFKKPWFKNTGDYILICKDRTISKYTFK